MTQAGITELMAVGKVYREFIDFFTDPMRISGNFGEIRQKSLTGTGGDVVHWGFGKAGGGKLAEFTLTLTLSHQGRGILYEIIMRKTLFILNIMSAVNVIFSSTAHRGR